MVHISPWTSALGLLDGAARILSPGAPLIMYGPWLKDDMPTAPSNLAFDQPIDVVALLTSPGNGPQPRMPRIELNCAAWVREDADIHRTRTINISQGGICVEGDSPLTVDADVIVSLAGLGPIAAHVKWQEGYRHGIKFNRVLAVNELMAFLRQQQRFTNRCAVA
jgi:hypothetical protein